MDTINSLLETKTAVAVGGAGSVWLSFVEWLPFWLRIAILLGTCLTIWIRLVREFRKSS